MRGDSNPIRVLHVDDDKEFVDLTATMLEGTDGQFSVETAHSATGGKTYFEESEFDCIVAGYDIGEETGIEFLEWIREEWSDIPFILFTGKGSEEVASEAISANVTDYLQKDSTTDQYELLANQIETVVAQYRAERELERKNDLFSKAQDMASVGAWEYDMRTEESYATDELVRIHDLPPEEGMTPRKSLSYYHPDDRPKIREAFSRAKEEGESYDLQLRMITETGKHRWVRTRGEPQYEEGEVVRLRGTLQDITEQKHREKSLVRENERLEEFAHVVSHDIRSPLQVAIGQLEYAEETGSDRAFQMVRKSHKRIEALIEDLLTLAKQGYHIGDKKRVEISDIAYEAWQTVDTSKITLKTMRDYEVDADPDRLRQMFENLFRNAAEHGGDGVTVTVGPIERFPTTTRGGGDMPDGFYVSDDGPGIPEIEREDVFNAGYTTSEDGTGFGLSIVKQVVEAHNWDIEVTEGAQGGARFEITGANMTDAS